MEIESRLFFLISAVIIAFVIVFLIPIGLWFQAKVSGVRITIIDLLFMKWRKVPPALIVNSMISLAKGGVVCKRDELEAHYLAGGDIQKVTDSLIQSKTFGRKLSFKEAAQMDLANKKPT
ncbi:MAG: hypothetical protein CVT94_13255 [Bacteroidetes bacterium HGW-Bacteroidetes-11]|jgi:uncharacterized protein YqfA (UPF0365 family)|nr:MAG: hypothetical protein CVT94_13255 [Bacteroidetes bacterium HGW-Bacteroidetes-11]